MSADPNSARSCSTRAGSRAVSTSWAISAERAGSGRSSVNAASSGLPERPGSAAGITRTQRQSSGIAWRVSNGAGSSDPGRRPPSTTKPPRAKVHRPTAERAPRPAIRAIAAGSGDCPASAHSAAVTASASFVPEPRPACGGMASSTRTCAPVRPSASRQRRATARARSASGPSAVSSSLALASTTTAGRLTATPRPPKRRGPSPEASSMPMCSRADASTRTVVIRWPIAERTCAKTRTVVIRRRSRRGLARGRCPSPRARVGRPSCPRRRPGAPARRGSRPPAAGGRATRGSRPRGRRATRG